MTTYDLTQPQRLIYDMERFAGGAVAVICGSVLVGGDPGTARMARAANELFRMNDALRTRIVEDGDGARQAVADYRRQEFEVLEFADKDGLDAYASAYAREPLGLHGRLCEVKIVRLPGRGGALVKLHHIVGDAWSLALLASQLCELLAGGHPKAYAYEEFADDERRYLESGRHRKDRAFFLEQYARCDEVCYLSERQSSDLSAARKTFVLGDTLSHRMGQFEKGRHTSPFSLFVTAFAIYMSRIKMNARSIYVGTVVLNRAGVRAKHTVGAFVNTVPFLVELDYDRSFVENLSSVEESSLSHFRHQRFHYNECLAAIRDEHGSAERLFDVVISYQNAAINSDDRVESTWYHSGIQAETLQIHIEDRDQSGALRVHYDYRTSLLSERDIDELHRRLCNLLLDGLENGHKRPHELELLGRRERRRLLFDFNDTKVEYRRDRCFHELFEERVEEAPDRTAVIACDRTLTYGQLNEEANRVAHGLRDRGIGIGDIVALALPRRSFWFSTMLGIVKTGAAYLPINPEYPAETIRAILTDSNAALYITENNVDEYRFSQGTENLGIHPSSSDTCYCIYTSGSTGMPKGTLITHKNVMNFVSPSDRGVACRIIRHSDTRILSVASVWFDMFVTQSLLPLACGKEILFANEEQSKIQSKLDVLLREYPVDVIESTPTKLKLLIADGQHREYLRGIKRIIVGGEALDESFVRRLRSLTDADIYNNYGPTETTVWSASNLVPSSNDVSIGKPVANTQVYVVDKYLSLMPVGVTGELCIAGDGVGKGYLNRPELTAERFVRNPFGEGRLYRTGDLAYWREDGNLVYVGRNDFQVKIRGLRVELGEIESAMSELEGVSQSVVVVRKDAGGHQYICAFCTGEERPAKEVRADLGRRLPRYMLPHVVTWLDGMPLTPNGKVDRKALPEVDLARDERGAVFAEPVGELETRLASLVGEVLGRSPVGRDDDFFDLGGDSLRAIELVTAAHVEGIRFDLQDVFDHPTVRKMAERIEGGDGRVFTYEGRDFSAIDRMLAGNRIECLGGVQAAPLGNLLLTGATGFLGAHVLTNFLDRDSGTAYCLVRGRDSADSECRLSEALGFYFGDRYHVGDRVRVLRGDLRADCLGLPGPAYEALLGEVDTVVNAAATVKHYGSYGYFQEANVRTVERIVRFCDEAGARLVHVSTLSVSGGSFRDASGGHAGVDGKRFDETSLYVGQSLDNVYVRSKFEAEVVALGAAQRGMDVAVMRMGNLTNRLSDGVFQRNHESNAFLKRLGAVMDMGVVPDYLLGIPVEFTPVDVAAEAVMALARHHSRYHTVFHVSNPNAVRFGELVKDLGRLGYPLGVVGGEEFKDLLRAGSRKGGGRQSLEAFINDVGDDGRLDFGGDVGVDCGFTIECLRRMGFEWPTVGLSYLRKYMDYFRGIGYWEV